MWLLVSGAAAVTVGLEGMGRFRGDQVMEVGTQVAALGTVATTVQPNGLL